MIRGRVQGGKWKLDRIGKWQLSFGSEMSGLTQYLMESIMGDFKARYNNFHSSIFNNLFLLCIERRSNFSQYRA